MKPRLWDETADRAAVSGTLLWVLERCLRLLHPLMPFVTEEVWSLLPGRRELLAGERWPVPRPGLQADDAESAVARAIEAVTALRRYRTDIGAPAAARIGGRLAAEGYDETLEHVARLSRFDLSSNGTVEEPVARVPVPGGAVLVLPATGLGAEAEERRRATRRAEIESEIARAEGKLANQRFVERAPVEVVGAERSKLAAFRAELEGLR